MLTQGIGPIHSYTFFVIKRNTENISLALQMTWLQLQGSCNCLYLQINILDKVQLFREGHKNLANISHGLDIYLVKSVSRTVAQAINHITKI